MLISLSVPAGHQRSPLAMEQLLTAIHRSDMGSEPMEFTIGNHGPQNGLFIRCGRHWNAALRRQLYAAYPDVRLDELNDDALDPEPGTLTWSMSLRLESDLFPAKDFRRFLDTDRSLADPLTALLGAIEPEASSVRSRITLRLQRAWSKDVRRAKRVLHGLASSALWLSPSWATVYAIAGRSYFAPMRWFARWLPNLFKGRKPSPEAFDLAKEKFRQPLFHANLTLSVSAPAKSARAAVQRLETLAGVFAVFTDPNGAGFEADDILRKPVPRERTFLLTPNEAAALWHPPAGADMPSPTLESIGSREFPPPLTLPTPANNPGLTLIGTTKFRGAQQQFGILHEDRLRHAVVIGKTGMGKSTLLQQLLASDLEAGRGLALIDPHGDLTETVLRTVPSKRTNDVILFDAADAEFPVAFNVLACADPSQRPLLASGVLSAFKKLFGDSWGPRLEHILRNALLTLLETPGSTLVTLLRLLGDARFRQRIVERTCDPIVRGFWEHEFAAWPPKLQAEAIAPVQNKVGHFVSSPLLRNIVGQPQNRLDLRRVLDEGKVLLVNLSKGRLGDDASGLLGSLLVTALQLAAMSRADVREDQRRPFFLYVDEFQNFATESFATILSEARKYRLGLTLAHQYLDQLDQATRSAVFGNVGTMISFQVGADDAESVAEQLGRDISAEDMLQLPKYQAAIRLLIDGMPSRPFTMRTIRPANATSHRQDIIRKQSRSRYARKCGEVETGIRNEYGRQSE